MIVATAGHIDHGKTLLVRALTGIDTDRLPEEKARGISIDLGFAYLPLSDGRLIGFVDVPGHERFVRNMLAGVCGIDFALLVVAADDGVMPQTIEHLHILDLLRVKKGAVVVTKVDRVAETRVYEAAEGAKALVAGTSLSDAPIVHVSAVTGAGMLELRQLLSREAAALAARESAGQYFRLAVDRAFVIAGSGTVVTGTVFNGVVRPNDKLLLSGRGTEVRVRAIQIHGSATTQASAGQRCAINLSGVDVQGVARGDWLLDAFLHNPSRRLDVRISLLRSEADALKHWTPVHLHLASANVLARVAIRGAGAITPGGSGLAQLLLETPMDVLHGDRFILRDQSATRTLGGGEVLDPFAAPIRSRDTGRLAQLAAMQELKPEAALAPLVRATDDGLELVRLEKTFNIMAERAAAIYEAANIVRLGKDGGIGLARERHAAILQAIPDALELFHHLQPEAVGQNVDALRRAVAPRLPPDAFHSFLRELRDAGTIELAGSVARKPGHDATSNANDEKLWEIIQPAMEEGGFMPPSVRHFAEQVRLPRKVVEDFLHRKAMGGDVVKVCADRFYLRSTLASLVAIAESTARSQPGGLFTVSQYRDATGASRRAVIKVLEYLDSVGVTKRIGDARKMSKEIHEHEHV